MPGYPYDRLEVGQTFGPHHYHLTREAIAQWCRLHGQSPAPSLDPQEARRRGYRDVVAPAGMAFIFSLQAITHLDILPPGVILAGEELRFGEPPCAGDTVATTIAVVEKYLRKERRYVVLEITSRLDGGRVAVTQRFTGIWPQ